MEARQDQFLLAGIGIDVADRKDAGHAGLELLGVDRQRLALEREPPLRHRPELGVQAKESEQVIGRQVMQ